MYKAENTMLYNNVESHSAVVAATVVHRYSHSWQVVMIKSTGAGRGIIQLS